MRRPIFVFAGRTCNRIVENAVPGLIFSLTSYRETPLNVIQDFKFFCCFFFVFFSVHVNNDPFVKNFRSSLLKGIVYVQTLNIRKVSCFKSLTCKIDSQSTWPLYTRRNYCHVIRSIHISRVYTSSQIRPKQFSVVLKEKNIKQNTSSYFSKTQLCRKTQIRLRNCFFFIRKRSSEESTRMIY